MQAERSIVLVFGSQVGAGQVAALASEGSTLESMLRASTLSTRVTLLSYGISRSIPGIAAEVVLDRNRPGATDRLLRALGAIALYNRLATIPIGRLINSLGPVDPGRVFWRAVRRNPAARALLVDAALAVAGDAPAIKTAWLAQRRRWVDEAIYDHRAASIASVEMPTT